MPPETIFRVIVHDPGGLQERIDNNRTNEFKAAPFELFRDPNGEFILGRHGPRLPDGPASGEIPQKLRKIFPGLLHFQIYLRPA